MIAKKITVGFCVITVMMASGLQARPAWKRRQVQQTQFVQDVLPRRQPLRDKVRLELDLSSKKITVLTAQDVAILAERYPQLRELDLSGNELTTLPAAVAKLKKLRKLNLSRNRLVVLPVSIGTLAKLEELDVSRNQLMQLSGSTGQLKKLKKLRKLYIYGNRLERAGIKKIKNSLPNKIIIWMDPKRTKQLP